MKWLYRLDYKYGRRAIENLMFYVVVSMAVVYIMDMWLYNSGISESGLMSLLYFDRNLILQGQFWRVISFVILPPDSSVIFILFSLYFYYMIGTTLEKVWSSFRFNAYYLFGIIGTIIFGFVTGATTNYYLNMSLFFAFAVINPDYELRIFFVLPVKIKYLAIIDAVYFILELVVQPIPYKIALLVALGNFALFFWEDFMGRAKLWYTHIKSRRNFRR